MRFFAVALFVCGATASYSQAPVVPSTMVFAGITLTLSDDARQEIQKDVNLLTQYTRYFNMKVDRAKAYFPLIEKVFAEEGVPDDFKFLVLQESALVADAVSVSNAVGFWQFKDYTAMEMGMRVDKEIDERMNLISSTHGAARYLKQSNYYFNNWLLALQAYQMGTGGVRRIMGDSLSGVKTVAITTGTYWYVKKYLAHKVAFENALGGDVPVRLVSYVPRANMTLQEIATEVSTGEESLKEYNKWLKTSSIPADKTYTVLVPGGKVDQDFTKLILASNKASRAVPVDAKESTTADGKLVINSIPAMLARTGDNPGLLAQRAGISLSALLKNNDISIDHPVAAGDIYFLSRKKSTAAQETYKVRAGDDLWSISQKFGVRMKNLRKYNRLDDDGTLAPGTVVWLQSVRPHNDVVLLATDEEAVTLDDDSFDWYIKSPKEPSAVEDAPQTVVVPRTDQVSEVQPAPVVNIANETEPEKVKEDGLAHPGEHLVVQGETLYAIAKQYGVQVTDLLTWNNLTVQNGLRPGQVLKIVENRPVETEVQDVKTAQPVLITHEVKASDTLYSVARQYGVTIKDIMDWNHKKDFSLSRGEKLEIRQHNP